MLAVLQNAILLTSILTGFFYISSLNIKLRLKNPTKSRIRLISHKPPPPHSSKCISNN